MIIGHTTIIKDLKRLADARGLPHALLFFGAPRIGKRTVAIGLAKHLESSPFETLGENEVLHDALVVAPNEEGSIGIDEAREIKKFLVRLPNVSPYRTLIIDTADALTREAQNALLKITEEPPASSLIILTIQDPERIIPTLRSRFQKLFFAPVRQKEIANWLIKAHTVPGVKAEAIAERSGGAPGLAYAIFFDEKFQEMYQAAEQFLGATTSARLVLVKEIIAAVPDDKTFDLAGFLDALLLILSSTRRKEQFDLLHRIFELRRNVDYFPLNPRLQLTALANLL